MFLDGRKEHRISQIPCVFGSALVFELVMVGIGQLQIG